jgi:phosphohistidine phosphatase
MELHLIRHADAGRATGRDGDQLRELTPSGREQCAALRGALERLGVRYRLLLCSPWTRARQTAGELAGLAAAQRDEDLLAAPPGEGLVTRLRLERGRFVALVGHEPWLGELTALLLTGDAGLGDRFPFKKCGLYALRWPEPTELRYVLTPALIGGLDL